MDINTRIDGFEAVEYRKDTETTRQHVWREPDFTWSARIIRRSDDVLLGEVIGKFATRLEGFEWCKMDAP